MSASRTAKQNRSRSAISALIRSNAVSINSASASLGSATSGTRMHSGRSTYTEIEEPTSAPSLPGACRERTTSTPS